MKEISAGGIIINKDKFLICRSTKSYLQDGSEIWGFPKGHEDKEDGGVLYLTALREIKEETNIDAKNLKLVNSVLSLSYAGKKKNFVFFPFKLLIEPEDLDLRCNTLVTDRDYPEIDMYKWVTVDEARSYIKNHMTKVLDYIEINSEKLFGL